MEERERNDRDAVAKRRTVTSASAREPAGNLGPEFELPMLEPITPELALIDPELARHARARLPDMAKQGRDHRRIEEPERERPTGLSYSSLFELAALDAPVALEATETWPAYAGRRRRKRVTIAATAMLLLAALAAGVVVANEGVRDRVEGLRDRVPLLRDVWTSPAATPAQPRARTSAVRTQSTRSAATVSKAPAIRPRAFAWVPSPRATHYRVRFFAGARTIFVAWPVRARLTLPREWTYQGHRYRLSPGRYRWEVEPGYGRRGHGRYGKAIVRARLVVH
jgi:hypothetical protein